jgi:hypothetical protein
MQDLLKSHYAIELFWFPLNSIDLDAVLVPEKALENWDPYKDDMWQVHPLMHAWVSTPPVACMNVNTLCSIHGCERLL